MPATRLYSTPLQARSLTFGFADADHFEVYLHDTLVEIRLVSDHVWKRSVRPGGVR